MPKPNLQFELSPEDLELIEDALRARAPTLGDPETDIDPEARDIQDLLGRLHNQKIFYRPSDGPYVGG